MHYAVRMHATALTTRSAGPSWLGVALAMCGREWTRFFRQRSRLIGALVTPAVFWLLLGTGLNNAALIDNGDAAIDVIGYRAYFFPGAAVMVLMFNTIFAAYGLIEDKRDGLLRAVLVAPAPRGAVITGKVLGGATVATAQATLFLLMWPFVTAMPAGVDMALGMLGAVGVLALIAIGLTALGFVMAWPLESSAGLHAVLNLVLFPAWFLSGAVFPIDGTAGWLQGVMLINPLTYAVAAFHSVLLGQSVAPGGVFPLAITLPVAATAAGVLLLGAVQVARRRGAR